MKFAGAVLAFLGFFTMFVAAGTSDFESRYPDPNVTPHPLFSIVLMGLFGLTLFVVGLLMVRKR